MLSHRKSWRSGHDVARKLRAENVAAAFQTHQRGINLKVSPLGPSGAASCEAS